MNGHFSRCLFLQFGALIGMALAPLAQSQPRQDGEVALGKLANGAAVKFIRSNTGQWGIEISGAGVPRIAQPKPAQIEVYLGEQNVSDLAAAYDNVQKVSGSIVAKATVAGKSGAAFAVEDQWTISGDALSLNRRVTVTSPENDAGFYSGIWLATGRELSWTDAKFLAPGLLYGQPHTRATAPGGSASYDARRFSIREDYLPAPLFGLSLSNGYWAAVMDLAPRGDTTQAETTAPATKPVIDQRLQFGALGAQEVHGGGVALGFWFPGTTTEFAGGSGFGGGPSTPIVPVVRRRYHPVKTGFSQTYRIGFRFGKSASFRDMEHDAFLWTWQTLKPKVVPIDVDVVRRTLIDHLADRVLVVDDRAGLPFVIDSVTGKPGSFRPALLLAQMPHLANAATSSPEVDEIVKFARSRGIDIDPGAAELNLWPKIMMGFCGKNIEAAGEFLIEGDRDPGPRGQRLRSLGLKIIESFIRIDTMSPAPDGEGFDIRTGKPGAVRGAPSFALRATAEEMRAMIDVIRRERAHGREHPEWFAWAKAYTDWLLTVQREDGSFPEDFQGSTGKAKSTSGGTSYATVPLLVRMSEDTGDKKYLDAGMRAADYIWSNYGSQGVYIGATGNDIADKESGMLSMEAFLALYDNTKESKWLERAQSAAEYAASYIWIWNVPMPLDANDSELAWKRGVPTIGLQGIGSDVAGHSDEYLDWAAPSYAKLYEYTKDEYDLDVARILLHDTKSMLALPGRTYDLLGPGWQQEHWRMGPGVRGIGAHRTWLPWISVNHLHSITGLEEFDPVLFKQLAKGE
jgi:hypothetical protein